MNDLSTLPEDDLLFVGSAPPALSFDRILVMSPDSESACNSTMASPMPLSLSESARARSRWRLAIQAVIELRRQARLRQEEISNELNSTPVDASAADTNSDRLVDYFCVWGLGAEQRDHFRHRCRQHCTVETVETLNRELVSLQPRCLDRLPRADLISFPLSEDWSALAFADHMSLSTKQRPADSSIGLFLGAKFYRFSRFVLGLVQLSSPRPMEDRRTRASCDSTVRCFQSRSTTFPRTALLLLRLPRH